MSFAKVYFSVHGFSALGIPNMPHVCLWREVFGNLCPESSSTRSKRYMHRNYRKVWGFRRLLLTLHFFSSGVCIWFRFRDVFSAISAAAVFGPPKSLFLVLRNVKTQDQRIPKDCMIWRFGFGHKTQERPKRTATAFFAVPAIACDVDRAMPDIPGCFDKHSVRTVCAKGTCFEMFTPG